MSQESINQKIVKFARVTGRTLALAEKLVSEATAKEAAALPSIGTVAQLLKSAGYIDAAHEKLAKERLGTYKGALEVLTNVLAEQVKAAATKSASSNVGSQGVAVPGPGSAPQIRKESQNPNYLGSRAGVGERRPSDEAMLSLIPGGRRY